MAGVGREIPSLDLRTGAAEDERWSGNPTKHVQKHDRTRQNTTQHEKTRKSTTDGCSESQEGLADLGLTYDELMACLGGACVDVFLNERAYWRCVPLRVWRYTIGGYQVMKKWLSYRERPLLGRDLRAQEARHVSDMARRIAALLLLEPALDANYAAVKADTYEWMTAGAGTLGATTPPT
jgi:hypothetical protein